jgi:hypothetical protein
VTGTVAEIIKGGALNVVADPLPFTVLKEVDRERVVRIGLPRAVPEERFKHARMDRKRLDTRHLLRPRHQRLVRALNLVPESLRGPE